MVPQTIICLASLANAGLDASAQIAASEIQHRPLSRSGPGVIECEIKDDQVLVITSIELIGTDEGATREVTARLGGEQVGGPTLDYALAFGGEVLLVFSTGDLVLTFSYQGLPASTSFVRCNAYIMPGRALSVMARLATKATVTA